MSLLISTLLFTALIIVSLLHLAWAFGSHFPCADEATLTRTVVGAKGMVKMPPRLASAFVAIATFFASLWPFVLAGNLLSALPQWLVSLGAIVLTIVFLGRGAAGYSSWFQALSPEQPFSTLDKVYYSPLCLALGVGFLTLTVVRFS